MMRDLPSGIGVVGWSMPPDALSTLEEMHALAGQAPNRPGLWPYGSGDRHRVWRQAQDCLSEWLDCSPAVANGYNHMSRAAGSPGRQRPFVRDLSSGAYREMADQHRELRRQLQAVEGEITEMARLIEQGEDCLAVVRRGLAAKQSLGAIGLTLIESHLRNKMMAVIACDDPDCRTHRVVRLAEVYETLCRFLCPACRNKWQGSPLSKSLESKEETDV